MRTMSLGSWRQKGVLLSIAATASFAAVYDVVTGQPSRPPYTETAVEIGSDGRSGIPIALQAQRLPGGGVSLLLEVEHVGALVGFRSAYLLSRDPTGRTQFFCTLDGLTSTNSEGATVSKYCLSIPDIAFPVWTLVLGCSDDRALGEVLIGDPKGIPAMHQQAFFVPLRTGDLPGVNETGALTPEPDPSAAPDEVKVDIRRDSGSRWPGTGAP